MSNKYIGVFDSGLGGVSVVKYLKKYLPEENIVFLADYKNCPYGSKSKEELLPIIKNNVHTLNSFDLKGVVIACNTAESVAGDKIKAYFKVPVYDVIKPTCIQAVSKTKNHRIGIIATLAATKSGKYMNTVKDIDSSIEVFPIATPELVPLIEAGKRSIKDLDLVEVLNKYIAVFIDLKIDTLILGCTHYDLLSDVLHELMPNVALVSSSECVAAYARDNLKDKNDSTNRQIEYYATADLPKFEKQASMVLDEPIQAKLI